MGSSHPRRGHEHRARRMGGAQSRGIGQARPALPWCVGGRRREMRQMAGLWFVGHGWWHRACGLRPRSRSSLFPWPLVITPPACPAFAAADCIAGFCVRGKGATQPFCPCRVKLSARRQPEVFWSQKQNEMRCAAPPLDQISSSILKKSKR
jgi:hypothetical protein